MTGHKFVTFRHLLINGRVKRGLEYPSRERSLVRKALSSLGIRYREAVVFINPYYYGSKDEYKDGTPQWLDFCIFKERMYAIIFYPSYKGSGVTKRNRRVFDTKIEWLKYKQIPYLILDRRHTSQVHKYKIQTFLERR